MSAAAVSRLSTAQVGGHLVARGLLSAFNSARCLLHRSAPFRLLVAALSASQDRRPIRLAGRRPFDVAARPECRPPSSARCRRTAGRRPHRRPVERAHREQSQRLERRQSDATQVRGLSRRAAAANFNAALPSGRLSATQIAALSTKQPSPPVAAALSGRLIDARRTRRRPS